MGWSDGSFNRTDGTYTGASVWAQNESNGFGILASRQDAHDKDLADGINATLTKDGSNSPSAHLNWLSTERVINSVTGTSNNYTASLSNAPSAYFTGLNFKFRPNHTNDGTATINVNSLGAKTIKIISDVDGTKSNVVAGHLVKGFPSEVYYDGTDFILCSHPRISLEYNPTLDADLSGGAIGPSFYQLDGSIVSGTFNYASGALNGGSTHIDITPPVAIAVAENDTLVGTGVFSLDGTIYPCTVFANTDGTDTLEIYEYEGGLLPSGSVAFINITFRYTAA
jgi:hypothetical protein